jgi:hypothetical protein
MTFFYDLNKKLADLAKRQDLTESAQPAVAEGSTGDYSAKKAAAGKDIGKPGKMFSKIAKSAGERYGSKESGERVAGAVLAKLRSKNESTDQGGDVMDYLNDKLKDFDAQQSKTDESALQAYLGKKKYGDAGMKALQKAGRDGASKETMARIRARHDKMDEADMEEGNKFTGNLMKARAAGLKKADLDGDGDMEPVREADVVGLGEKKKAKPDYIDLDKDGNKKETMKKAAADKKKSRSAGTAFDPEVAKSMFAHKDDSRYDVKDTGYSKRYTRKPEPETDQDDEATSDAPKKKGRPAGTKRAIGAKGPTGKSKLMSKGSIKEMDAVALTDKGEYDQEGDMARDQLHTLVKASKELHSILADDDNLPEWVQSKITKALDYIKTANDYMDQEKHDSDNAEPVAEKAVSKKQQRFMGMVHAAQKGEKPTSKAVAKVAKSMGKKDAEDFAKTKHKGLPEKVKEADAEAPKEKKSSGGFQFGKGVYESLDKKYKQALTEGMNISVNMNTGPDGQPSKNITISADGDDAEALAALLKMAGIGGAAKEDVCPGCGKSSCGCEEELDENSPDWPTNTETSDDAMQYSGGLNGPKSTGQTTVPVIASQLRRQVSMEESVELERSLFRLYQNYKAQ